MSDSMKGSLLTYCQFRLRVARLTEIVVCAYSRAAYSKTPVFDILSQQASRQMNESAMLFTRLLNSGIFDWNVI